MYLWGVDDFLGDSIDARWNGVGTGSAAVVDAQDGGIIRITTGATANDAYAVNWADIRSLLVSKKVTVEYRAKLSQLNSVTAWLHLYNDGTHYINFNYDSGAANWKMQVVDGAGTTQDSGIAADTSYHIFKIECFPTGEIHYYIDNVECANSPITTNITTNYLQPRPRLQTKENVAKTMDIDYIQWRQDL